jgi:hypothetical protein
MTHICYVFCALLFPFFMHSQSSRLVIGKINTTTTHYKIFKKYTPSCLLDYSNADDCFEPKHIIVGDTSCNGIEKALIVFFRNDIYFIREEVFDQFKTVKRDLDSFKNVHPSLMARVDFVTLSYKDYLKQDSVESNIQLQQLKKSEDSLKKKLDSSFAIMRQRNIVIRSWNWSYTSEFSYSPSIEVSILNPFKKKIKYVEFSFKAYNAVDDLIKDGITGKSTISLRGIGPIGYAEIGSYEFESIIYSKVVDSIKLSSITITFYDGTIKVINNPISLNVD